MFVVVVDAKVFNVVVFVKVLIVVVVVKVRIEVDIVTSVTQARQLDTYHEAFVRGPGLPER